MSADSIELILQDAEDQIFNIFEKEKDWIYYSCYGQQARFIAQFFYKTSSVLKKENGMDSLIISKNLMSRIAKNLLGENISIQVWKKQADIWCKHKFASPGHSRELDCLIGVVDIESTIAAVHILKKGTYYLLGIAIANTSMNQLLMTELLSETNFLRFRYNT